MEQRDSEDTRDEPSNYQMSDLRDEAQDTAELADEALPEYTPEEKRQAKQTIKKGYKKGVLLSVVFVFIFSVLLIIAMLLLSSLLRTSLQLDKSELFALLAYSAALTAYGLRVFNKHVQYLADKDTYFLVSERGKFDEAVNKQTKHRLTIEYFSAGFMLLVGAVLQLASLAAA